jgi:hypothetical protein
MKLSTRSRRLVVAAGVAALFSAGIASAQAGFLTLSTTVSTSHTIALPIVPTTYHSVAGAASAYTPSLQGGTVIVAVTSAVGSTGVVVANSGFSCPSDAPNPIAAIRLVAGSGAVTVKARITGMTKLPDGNLASYDVTVGPGRVQADGQGMDLYSVCSA